MTAPTGQLKNIYIGNAYLVRQELRAYDAPSNTFLPWSMGPVNVSLCTVSINPSTGAVTYTPIPGLGPIAMSVGGVPGVWSVEIPTAAISLLNQPPYLNAVIYQVVTGGSANELSDVQPLLVSPTRYPF